MKMMMKPMLVLAGLATLAGPGRAEEEGGVEAWQPPRIEKREVRIRHQEALPDLTDEQRAELKKLRSGHARNRIRIEADVRILKMDLEELLAAPKVNEDAVRAKAAEMERLRAAAAKDRIEARLALRRVLTAEQAAKLEKLRWHRKHRQELRRGRRGA